MWTYVANHSAKPYKMMAKSAEEAGNVFLKGFHEDFRKRGTLFVFDSPPVFSWQDGKKVENPQENSD